MVFSSFVETNLKVGRFRLTTEASYTLQIFFERKLKKVYNYSKSDDNTRILSKKEDTRTDTSVSITVSIMALAAGFDKTLRPPAKCCNTNSGFTDSENLCGS